jgi:hypothetical protein
MCIVFLLLGLCILIVSLPWLRFFHAFSSVVRQMPGLNSPSRGTARTLTNIFCIVLKFCVVLKFCIVLCIVCFVSFCVLLVCKCVLYNCHRVATHLQLTNISYRIKYIRAFYVIMWQKHKIHYYVSIAITFARTCHIVTYIMYIVYIILSISLWNWKLKKNFLLPPCCCYFASHINITTREDFYYLTFYQEGTLAKCR